MLKYGIDFDLTLITLNDSQSHQSYEILQNYKDTVVEVMTKFVQPNSSRYHVLTHGDMWKNNILFKQTAGDTVIAEFIDFQIIRHASFALDVHYLMYTSVQLEIINSSMYEKLLSHYYNHFIDNLLKKDEIQYLNTEWFKNELKEYALYGLLYSFMTVHACYEETQKSTEQSDSSQNLVLDASNYVQQLEFHMKKLPHNARKSTRILSCVEHFMEHYGQSNFKVR